MEVALLQVEQQEVLQAQVQPSVDDGVASAQPALPLLDSTPVEPTDSDTCPASWEAYLPVAAFQVARGAWRTVAFPLEACMEE